jgi:superfamily II DNA or RNA helicase
MSEVQFSPGALIQARDREWMVLGQVDEDTIRVRPITGSEEDQTLISLSLEPTPIAPAQFPLPSPKQVANHETAGLLRDALLLSLRRGAGPFRSFGQIAVEPRAYQLVPLMMALKLDPVRLLIADDVGIGKTIEAGLIVRELLDRGEVDRFCVLCPPHLVDQWVSELQLHFNLQAVAVTAAGAVRLERGLPAGESIFGVHPFTVVSLDYIKSDKRRDEFVRACPEFVIVDEAHTCTMGGQGRHKRFELLKDLSANSERGMVLLTATPHSGDENAFYNLLGLLHSDFVQLQTATGVVRDELRARLSRHFVQRRRPDIEAWKDQSTFPERLVADLTYSLDGDWYEFFDSVLQYCREVVQKSDGDERRQRLNFWGTLALLRCASSSPAAAVQALRTRSGESDSESFEEQVFDGSFDSIGQDDSEPSAGNEDVKLKKLIEQASRLVGAKGDPKIATLTKHLRDQIKDGFSPVVFCRYIATAHYLHEALKEEFKSIPVDVITGELTADERKERVAAMGEQGEEGGQRLLIATDCLSEGINLQAYFTSVIHYDLSWNPTRHEQREGRVDRFGQKARKVRATLMYGANNPVDGAVLNVILRKAEEIRKNLGVPVPLPDDQHKLTQALMKAVLIRSSVSESQTEFDFLGTPEGQDFDLVWKNVAETAKKNRTIFAQQSIKPEEVLPEWEKVFRAIGTEEDVERFLDRALARLGASPKKTKNGFQLFFEGLPIEVRERLEREGIPDGLKFTARSGGAVGYHRVGRSHPLVHVLAEFLMESSLKSEIIENRPTSDLGRVGVWVTEAVQKKTTLVLLRLRHRLVQYVRVKGKKTQLVEETFCTGWSGPGTDSLLMEDLALKILSAPPVGTLSPQKIENETHEVLSKLNDLGSVFDHVAQTRSRMLLEDHRRSQTAAGKGSGSTEVEAICPVDVIGTFVLLPKI